MKQHTYARRLKNAMATVTNPEVARVEIRQTQDGELVENVFHARRAGGWTQEGLDLLTDIVRTWVTTSWVAVISSSVNFREVHAVVLSGGIALESTAPFIEGVNGDVADSDHLPNNVTLCVSKRTGFSGRSARGRWYVVGVPQASIAGNTVVGSYADSVAVALTQLQAAIATASAQFVVYSQFSGGAPRPTGVATEVSDFLVTDLTADSQRRRLPGRGQ